MQKLEAYVHTTTSNSHTRAAKKVRLQRTETDNVKEWQSIRRYANVKVPWLIITRPLSLFKGYFLRPVLQIVEAIYLVIQVNPTHIIHTNSRKDVRRQ